MAFDPSTAQLIDQPGLDYPTIFQDAEAQAGLPPGLLSAIAQQENVHPRHNNPLGISTDSGVRTFTPDEAPNQIYRMANLLTNPRGPYREFAQTGNIDALARVYSPVGARNDIYGTNASEAAGIRAALGASADPNIFNPATAKPLDDTTVPITGGGKTFDPSTAQPVDAAPQTATSTSVPSSDPIGDQIKLSEQLMADTQRNYPNRPDATDTTANVPPNENVAPQMRQMLMGAPSPLNPDLNPDPDRQLTPQDIALRQGIESYLQSRNAIGLATAPMAENWPQPSFMPRSGTQIDQAALERTLPAGPLDIIGTEFPAFNKQVLGSPEQAAAVGRMTAPLKPLLDAAFPLVKAIPPKTFQGLTEGLTNFGFEQTSPRNALLMASLFGAGKLAGDAGEAVNKLVGLGFAPSLAQNVVENAQIAYNTNDPLERGKALANVIGSGTFLGQIAHGTFEGSPEETKLTPPDVKPIGLEQRIMPPIEAPTMPGSDIGTAPITGPLAKGRFILGESTPPPEVAATVPSAPETTSPAAPAQAPSEVWFHSGSPDWEQPNMPLYLSRDKEWATGYNPDGVLRAFKVEGKIKELTPGERDEHVWNSPYSEAFRQQLIKEGYVGISDPMADPNAQLAIVDPSALRPIELPKTGGTEPTTPPETTATAISNAVDRMDTEPTHSGHADLANDLEAIPNLPKPLASAIQDYRSAVEEDRTKYGERSGLPEEFGDKLEAEARKFSTGTAPTETATPSAPASVDFSGKTERELEHVIFTTNDAAELQSAVAELKRRRSTSTPAPPPPIEPPPVQTAPEPIPDATTSLKRAVVDAERAARGATPIPTPETQHDEDVVAEAKTHADADPSLAPTLVSRIVDGGDRAVTEQDAATLLVERARLMNERAKWENVKATNSDPRAQAEAVKQLDDLEQQRERLDQAQRTTGSTWSRIGRMYQRLIAQDYSLDALLSKQSAVKGGPLNADERAAVAKTAAAIEKAQAEHEAARESDTAKLEDHGVAQTHKEQVAALQKELASRPKYSQPVFDIARKVVDRWKAEADNARTSLREKLSRGYSGVPDPSIIIDLAKIMRPHIAELGLNAAEVSARVLDEFGETVRPYIQSAWDKAKGLVQGEKVSGRVRAALKKGGIEPKAEPSVTDLQYKLKADSVAGDELDSKTVGAIVRAHIMAGVHGENELMRATHETVKGAYPDATERDVRRAYVDYGHATYPNPDAVETEIRENKALVRMQESIDRLKEGLDGLHTGRQRDKATQLIREKTAQLNELLKKRQGPPSPEKLASRDEARQTALTNRIADINKELETGIRRPPGEPIPMSDRTKALMAERDALQKKLNDVRRQREESDPAAMAQRQADYLERQRQNLQKEIDQLKAGGKEKLGTRMSRPLDPALEKMAQERDKLRSDLAKARAKPEAQRDAERMQKKLDILNDKINERLAKLSVGDLSKSGPGRRMNRPLPPDLEDAQQQLDTVNKQIADARTAARRGAKTPEERYNEMRMKAISKRMDDLARRTAAGDFTRRPKRVPPPKAEATQRAEIVLKGLQKKFDENILRQEHEKKSGFQKKLEATAGAARELAISGYHSLAKILGFDLAKLVMRPALEVAGTVAEKTTGRARGGLESGAGIRKALGAYYRGFGQGLKETPGVYRTRTSASDILYGKPKLNLPHWYDAIGSRLHPALKHAIFRADEERYRANGLANAEKSGLDPNNDLVRAAVNEAAYEKAQGSKLQENNIIARKVDEGHKWLEKNMPDTGEPDRTKFVTSTIIKTLLTKGIIKTPINWTSQVLQHGPGGLLVGGLKAAHGQLIRGLDRLTPREVDSIHGLLKVGSVGSALFALGAIDGTRDPKDRIFGGYYTGTKTEPGDVAPGHVRFGNTDLHYSTHNLLFAPAQAGATMIRMANSKARKSDPESRGIPAGAMMALVSLVSQAPVAGPLMRLGQHGGGDLASDAVTSSVVPQLVQNIAVDTDTQKRKATTLGEKFKMNIPGLRQQVPVKTDAGGSGLGNRMIERSLKRTDRRLIRR